MSWQSGPGFVYKGTPLQNRGSQQVIDAIVAVGAAWNQLMLADAEAKKKDPKVIVRPQIQVLAIGLVYGGPLPKNKPGPKGEVQYHLSHDIGIDADILRELTREAIGLFASQKAYEVKRVFFADTALTLPPNVAGPDSGGPHENHFHVQFLPLPPPKKKPR